MAGMARLDLIDAGRARRASSAALRRPARPVRVAARANPCRPARCAASPRRAVPAPPPSAAVARRPPVRGRPAAPARPAPIGTTVAWPRPAAGHAGWRAGSICAVLQIGVQHFDADHLGLERRSLRNQFIRLARHPGVPCRRQLAQLLFQVAPVGLRLCSRQGQPRRVGGGALRVALLQRARQRRLGLAQALGGRLRLLFQRPQFGFILLVAPDLILQQAQVAGGLRQLAAQTFSVSRSRARAARRVRASTAALPAPSRSSALRLPMFLAQGGQPVDIRVNCALARKASSRRPRARANTSSASPNTPPRLAVARVQQRAALGGHALRTACRHRRPPDSPDRRVSALADGPGRGPPAHRSDWPRPAGSTAAGMPACSGLLCPRPGKSRSPTAPPAHSRPPRRPGVRRRHRSAARSALRQELLFQHVVTPRV